MESLPGVLKKRDAVADQLGVTHTATASTFDVKKALTKRLELLDDRGLLTPSQLFPDKPTLVCQALADATKVYNSHNTQATGVVLKPQFDDSDLPEGEKMNSVHNLVIVALYGKDDSYDNMCTEIPGVRQKIVELMREGVTVNGKVYQLVIPLGGDLKLLGALLGLAGGKSEFACLYCESSTKDYNLCKADWDERGGLRTRDFMRVLRLQHFPEDEEYRCPAPLCNKLVQPTDGYPEQGSEYGESARQAEQRKHFGLVPGRLPFSPTDVLHYIIDVLHLILRTVPQIFRQTVQANCDPGALGDVAQWCFDVLDIVISDSVALQTKTGEKKLSVSAESWPGETCRKLLTTMRQ